MEDNERFGIYQADQVLNKLDPQLNLIQLIIYSINFLLILYLVNKFRKGIRERDIGSLNKQYSMIHLGILMMAFNDLIVASSRYITDGEFALLGHSKAIFYISGFIIFTLGWALQIDKFVRISGISKKIIQFIILIFIIVSLLTVIQISLVLGGVLNPDSGLLNLGDSGNFYATIISTLILLGILMVLVNLIIEKRKTSKYQMFYALIQFISLFIIILFLLIRGYAVSGVDRSSNPELYILLEYKVVTYTTFVLPISLFLLQIYLFQPSWMDKYIIETES